jgi:glycosyltransferase involved in cell wall biosynthesis
MSAQQPATLETRPRTRERAALAVVVPVYNEIENIDRLHDELTAALDALDEPYRIVYIDDGSRDGSKDRLAELAMDDPAVVFVDLRRNFGQTAAIAAGIDHADADVVVMMDADLQNDPADIPRLLAKMDEGFDVVSGWRRDRKDKFVTRRLPSMIANGLISSVTGVHLHDYGCTLKAYRREVVDEIRLYGEMHRFIPVFASAAGANIAEMVVNHRPRLYGKSKYGLWRTFKVMLDLITVKFLLSYRTTPMYLFGGFGLGLIGVSLLTLFIALLNKWIRGASLIRTPLPQLAATFFILGMQSILMGLLAELLVRTYHESQDKPTYVVRRVIADGDEHRPHNARNLPRYD